MVAACARHALAHRDAEGGGTDGIHAEPDVWGTGRDFAFAMAAAGTGCPAPGRRRRRQVVRDPGPGTYYNIGPGHRGGRYMRSWGSARPTWPPSGVPRWHLGMDRALAVAAPYVRRRTRSGTAADRGTEIAEPLRAARRAPRDAAKRRPDPLRADQRHRPEFIRGYVTPSGKALPLCMSGTYHTPLSGSRCRDAANRRRLPAEPDHRGGGRHGVDPGPDGANLESNGGLIYTSSNPAGAGRLGKVPGRRLLQWSRRRHDHVAEIRDAAAGDDPREAARARPTWTRPRWTRGASRKQVSGEPGTVLERMERLS